MTRADQNSFQKALIYLDANASHPLLSSVRKNLIELLDSNLINLGNPSSVHRYGQNAKRVVFELKECLSHVLGVKDPDEFILCSGATEALNLNLRGFARATHANNKNPHIVVPALEHAAVWETCEDLQNQKLAQIHKLCVNSQGVFEKEELFNIIESILSNDSQAAILINLQVANNEVGTCYDFSFLPELWEKWGPKVQLHRPKQKGGQHPYTEQKIWIALDAVQALGKLSENYLRRIIHFSDYFVLSSHKTPIPVGPPIL
jgi:cysteine sulfinate desulfinase/cysteine desulfurase-like protein